MDIFEISQKEYNNLIKNSLYVSICPDCFKAPDLVVDFKTFEKRPVGFKCSECGFETAVWARPQFISSGTKRGTPITPLNLAKTIFEAAEQWNSLVKGF